MPSNSMQVETITALVAGLTAFITALGLCIRRMRLKKVKMAGCCGSLDVQLANATLTTAPSDIETGGNSKKRPSLDSVRSISQGTYDLVKTVCGSEPLKNYRVKQ